MNHLTDYQINEIFDGLGDPTARRHIETCADCRARLDELQQFFTRLENLPDIYLTHDLTPATLAKLPQKPTIRLWSPWLAAQWGSLAGLLTWFSFEAAKVVGRFNVQSLKFKVQVPDLELSQLVSNLKLMIADFQLSDFNLPTIQLPTYQLPFTPSYIALLGISTLLLWVVGNVALLRGRPRVRA